MAAHRRQFLISRVPYSLDLDWEQIALGDGAILLHCPELEIEEARDLDQNPWYIVGNAFQADCRLPTPAKQLASLSYTDVPAATYTWAGRWTLVGPRVIVPDAAGLMSLFYHQRSQGHVLVSSSLALLKLSVCDLKMSKRRLGQYGMNWFPPPSTRLSNVWKVLPDQTLDTFNGTVSYLKRTFPERVMQLSTDKRATIILRYLTNVFRQLAAKSDRLCVALTAGRDSRVSFAVALATGIKIEAVTMIYPGMARADRVIPKTICAQIGVKHSFLNPLNVNGNRQRIYDAHTLFNTYDWDRYFYSAGVFDSLPVDAYLIRSGCWEIGRNFYYRKFKGLTWQEVNENPTSIVWKFGNIGTLELLTEQLRQWLSWRKMHPEPFDWKDIFYRDQRLGGWLSAIEQSLDMAVGGRSVQPANCSAIFDLLLSEEGNLRGAGMLQKQIVELSGTGLGSFPINPPLNTKMTKIVRQIRNELSLIVGEMRNMVGY